MKESGKRSLLWLLAGVAGFFVILSFINNLIYPFPAPFSYALSVIQIPALIAGALVTGRDSINWIVFYVALFCIYIIIFSILIFIFQIVLAKAVKPRRKE